MADFQVIKLMETRNAEAAQKLSDIANQTAAALAEIQVVYGVRIKVSKNLGYIAASNYSDYKKNFTFNSL